MDGELTDTFEVAAGEEEGKLEGSSENKGKKLLKVRNTQRIITSPIKER